MSSPTPVRAAIEHAPQDFWASKANSVLYSPAWMVAVGFAGRMIFLLASRSYQSELNWVSFEMAVIGKSLAAGHGFASPWGGSTGPTAWTAPLYPWLVALALRLCGMQTQAAAFILFTFNSVVSALTSWTIYRIASRVFNQRTAVWAGWFWAIYPYAIYWSIRWIWETTLSTFLLSLLLLLTLEMEGDNRPWTWVRYGALWAVVALTNTSLLSFLPFAGGWLAYRLFRLGKSFLWPVVASALVFWVVITPWLMRNYLVFDKFIFIRGDVGSELRTGNNPDANGTWVKNYRAGNNVELFFRYKRMGEVAFDAEQGRLARAWIAEHPRQFLWLSCERWFKFWIGQPDPSLRLFKPIYTGLAFLGLGGLLVGFHYRIHGMFLFATLLVFYPLTYYFVFATDRYRHPIEPELVILSVWLFLAKKPPATARAPSAQT